MRNLPSTDARYWASAISACTIGETLGDYISHSLKLGYGLGSVGLIVVFTIVMVIELRAHVANEARYWTALIITSTTGTTMADFTTRSLNLGYKRGSVAIAAVMLVLLFLWRKSSAMAAAPASTDSVLPHVDVSKPGDSAVLPHAEIKAPKTSFAADALYWFTLLLVATFGTTMGDFCSSEQGLDLGAKKATLLLGLLLAAVLAVELLAKTKNRARYWSAFVIASTVGATFGDYLTKEDGLHLGNGLGTLCIAAVFAATIVVGKVFPARRAAA